MMQDKLMKSADSPMPNSKLVANPVPTPIPEKASVAEASEYSEFVAPNFAAPSEMTRLPTMTGTGQKQK